MALNTSSTLVDDGDVWSDVPTQNPKTNSGVYELQSLDSWGSLRHCLLRFTLPSTPLGVITKIDLLLTQNTAQTSVVQELHQANNGTWVGTTCTWNSDGGNINATVISTGSNPTTVDTQYRLNIMGGGASNPLSSLTWGNTVNLVIKNQTETHQGWTGMQVYGKDSTTSAANKPQLEITYTPYNTPINDQFEDASVNTSIWTTAGSVSESGGSLTLTGANGTCTASTLNKYMFKAGCTFECYGNLSRTTLSGHALGFANPGAGNAQCLFYNGWNLSANIYVNHSGDDGVNVNTDLGVACSGTGTKHTFKIIWRTDGQMEYYIDGTLKYTSTHSVTGSTYPMPIQFGNVYDTGSVMQFDYATLTVPGLPPISLIPQGRSVVTINSANF